MDANRSCDRRRFLKAMGLGAASAVSALSRRMSAGEDSQGKPNVILCMTDDQGWGDVGYNGHPVLKTPALDAMSRQGLRFDRFYAAAPVCSPTRGSALTGRHPYRYGILFANVGHMKKEEVTLAEVLKAQGYVTGHFGKWHLGTLTTTEKDSNRGGPRGVRHYSPPWENGFEECFSTEAKVPTWNPMLTPSGRKGDPTRKPYGTWYWTGPGEKATGNLEGDDSRIIMDRVILFIERAAARKTPFLAVIWFHSPHLPVIAGPKHRALYADQPEEKQHYYGCITAMDEQVGRLRSALERLGLAGNTMLWFTSDNGPEGKAGKAPGSAGPLRGRKRSLYEGGIRVPGLLVWPERIRQARRVTVPCSTSDYYPTILEVLGVSVPGGPRPMDGVSLVPLIDGRMAARPGPIGFQSGEQVALIGNRYKLYAKRVGGPFELYDLVADPAEGRDLAAEKPDIVTSMRRTLEDWMASCAESSAGRDYR